MPDLQSGYACIYPGIRLRHKHILSRSEIGAELVDLTESQFQTLGADTTGTYLLVPALTCMCVCVFSIDAQSAGLSGSDLRGLVRSALMGPCREAIVSKHFKKQLSAENEFGFVWIPCNPSDEGALFWCTMPAMVAGTAGIYPFVLWGMCCPNRAVYCCPNRCTNDQHR